MTSQAGHRFDPSVSESRCSPSLIPASAFGATKDEADSVYLNGNIYTVDASFSKVTAMAIKGQKLLSVGTADAAKAYIGANTKAVDLKGKVVLPGLIEGHMHFPMLGGNLLNIDVFNKPKARNTSPC